MRQILIIGAGKSTSVLIDYLLKKSSKEDLFLTIADKDLKQAQRIAGDHPASKAVSFDVFNKNEREALIQQANIVVSMLPAKLHIEVARDCIRFGRNMVTASYVSKEMKALDAEAKEKGLVFMNEIGVDPGIDHMSAMQVIDRIRDEGGKMLMFESFTGGLVAPESDNNLWNYKFTWNHRNVVVAGQ